MLRFKSVSLKKGLLLLVLVFLFVRGGTNAADKKPEHFYFVQITDTHIGDDDHLNQVKKAVKMINALPMKIECVVHTGDITMQDMEEDDVVQDTLDAFQKLKVPVHYVPGNNDILPHRLRPSTDAYTRHFGKLITMKEYHQVVFLFVYTEPLRNSFSVDGYDPLKEVEDCLKKSKGKPVILFHHAPCVTDFYNNAFHEKWNAQNKKKWIALVNQYNVKAVIAGHFHRAELHWLGSVPLYVAPPVAGYWGRQASFRIYEYTDGKIGYRTQYFE